MENRGKLGCMVIVGFFAYLFGTGLVIDLLVDRKLIPDWKAALLYACAILAYFGLLAAVAIGEEK